MLRENRYLYGTVFLTGAAVLILEIAAVRLLSPHYGSSLYVFSSVLTVILAALSIGYWFGGKRADTKQSFQDLFTIIALSGITVLTLHLLSQMVLKDASEFFSVRTGPLMFSLVFFFIPGFLLGIVSPYIIKLQSLHTSSEHIGAVVGQTFFWGTLGSIVGSLATGFVLIPSLGVHLSILSTGVLLVLIGVVVPYGIKKPLPPLSTVLVIAISIIFTATSYAYQRSIEASYVYYSDGLYSSVAIEDKLFGERPVRILHRDTNNSSGIYLDSTDFVFGYAQTALLYQTLVPDAEEFLLIGGGTYTIPRTLAVQNPNLTFDVVEIEPELFDLGKKYFDLRDTSRINDYSMDARVFLRTTEKTYDAIFGDAFGTDGSVPFHLATQEFFTEIKQHLAVDGVFMMNVIGIPKTTRPSLVGSLTKTLTNVFPNTSAFALNHTRPGAQQNIVFISRNGDAPIKVNDAVITDYLGNTALLAEMELNLDTYNFERELQFTDDRAPVEYLVAKQ